MAEEQPTNNKQVILKLTDIRKTFLIGNNNVEIIKGVSFEVDKGDFVILFGPSGCGKSTVLNILLGLEPPTEGKVHFLGEDMYQFDDDTRAQKRKTQIGMVYQQSNWIKSLNVIENVAFPLTLRGVTKAQRDAKALDMLALVSMQHAAKQRPTELSSGQQQRISLARALISEPALLVADEPTGNLDSKASVEMMKLFKAVNEDDKTVIMVTHDLEYLKFASRAVQMSDGLVVKVFSNFDDELQSLSVSKRGNIDLDALEKNASIETS